MNLKSQDTYLAGMGGRGTSGVIGAVTVVVALLAACAIGVSPSVGMTC